MKTIMIFLYVRHEIRDQITIGIQGPELLQRNVPGMQRHSQFSSST